VINGKEVYHTVDLSIRPNYAWLKGNKLKVVISRRESKKEL